MHVIPFGGIGIVIIPLFLGACAQSYTPTAGTVAGREKSNTTHGLTRQVADSKLKRLNLDALLNRAIDAAQYNTAESLIERGANPYLLVNHEADLLSLVVATRPCPANLVRAIVVAGRNPNVARGGDPPLLLALSIGNDKCASALLSLGADYRAIGKAGETALHDAVMGSSIVMVKRLIQRGLDVNARIIRWGSTPLTLAAGIPPSNPAGRMIIQTLLAHGADPCLTDSRGMSPADYAAHVGMISREKMLKKACGAFMAKPRKQHFSANRSPPPSHLGRSCSHGLRPRTSMHAGQSHAAVPARTCTRP